MEALALQRSGKAVRSDVADLTPDPQARGHRQRRGRRAISAYAATSPESVSPGAVRSDVALPAFRAGRDPPFT
jgi:hypothetical protein